MNGQENAYGGGRSDAFVAKLSPTGALVYSTYLGGGGNDSGSGIAIDSSGAAFVTGSTNGGFPTVNAVQSNFGGGYDAFFAKLSPSGALVYSTYLGGPGTENSTGIATDGTGAAYIVGITDGRFPTLNAFQSTFGGIQDAFIAKFSASPSPVVNVIKTHVGNFAQGQQNATYIVTVSNTGAGPTSGIVTVTDTVPAGLTFVSMTGAGWSCSSNSCNRSDALASGASYQQITVTVNVKANATSPQVNHVDVTGGGSAFDASADDSATIGAAPVLSVTKTHLGNFSQGQQNATYTVTVSNAGTNPALGTVTVTDTVPAGFTFVSMTGAGWSCSSSSCNRSDALASGASYQQITVTVNVKANATSPQVNHVDVTGGGSAGASADDSTAVVPAPVLNIAKTHTGNFTQGQVGATYTVTVSNAGNAGTSGTVTVTETAPTDLTVISMAGAGWTCNTATCTRSDALTGGSSYPAITVTVNVAGNAGSPLLNQVSASGGGSVTANASDSTIVNKQPILSVNRKVLNYGISGSLVTSPQTVLVTITGGVNVAWTAVSDHSNITVNPGTGAGTGTFQITATAGSSGTVTVATPGAANSAQTITVNIASVTPMPPFGSFDTPVSNTTGVVGAIHVTDWELYKIEVTHVDILREPIAGES